MKRQTTYDQPTTYAEIVAAANKAHERRLADLRKAEKIIRAIEGDLTLLAEHGARFSVGEDSMYVAPLYLRGGSQNYATLALRIDTGIFSDAGDRLSKGFVELGWLIEDIDAEAHFPKVVLRRPKTKLRVLLYVSKAHAGEMLLEAR
jgi:hypothetical protein